jgi:hypothetical protein
MQVEVEVRITEEDQFSFDGATGDAARTCPTTLRTASMTTSGRSI